MPSIFCNLLKNGNSFEFQYDTHEEKLYLIYTNSNEHYSRVKELVPLRVKVPLEIEIDENHYFLEELQVRYRSRRSKTDLIFRTSKGETQRIYYTDRVSGSTWQLIIPGKEEILPLHTIKSMVIAKTFA